MRYIALATDYDGTLAHHGVVDQPTIAALKRFRESGRKLILVTGREIDELLGIFPEIGLFDRVVAENGALIYRPATREEEMLCEPPDSRFIERLKQAGATPLSVGRTIVGTREPYETVALEAIRDLGLELQVIFNKGAVMVLPSGVNKATGLRAALEEMGLSPHNVVGVGDAENDHALLQFCECGVAVGNALPTLKEHADWVTTKGHSEGVTELMDAMIQTDLRDLAPTLKRHELNIGADENGLPVCVRPYGLTTLIAGPSGSGKSTLVTAILEALVHKKYQFCLVDPEGDYENLAGAATVGHDQEPPNVKEVLDLLQQTTQNVVVNLLGLRFEDRPRFFHELFPRLQEMRARTARPHWIIIDETHHLLPASARPVSMALPRHIQGLLMITLEPDRIAAPALHYVDQIVAVGEKPISTIRNFAAALNLPGPPADEIVIKRGEALVWPARGSSHPTRFKSAKPKGEHRRHRRKYVQGALDADESFYFRGRSNKLKLRAENLGLFMRIADGVDDDTWLFHLQRGEYSAWFRQMIKDPELADEAEKIETTKGLSAEESRKRIQEAIARRYTL